MSQEDLTCVDVNGTVLARMIDFENATGDRSLRVLTCRKHRGPNV